MRTGADDMQPYDARQHLALFAGRMLRLGSYGDPVAAPVSCLDTACACGQRLDGLHPRLATAPVLALPALSHGQL